MNKAVKHTFYSAALSAALLSGFTTMALAGNNGSVKTVSDCSHVNDNQFSVNQTVWGKGQNFDDNADYRWTIVKVDQPGQGTQVADGTFHLNGGENSFCINLGDADITSGDSPSEYKWEVEQKKDYHSWKKVDSDNFSVEANNQSYPTPTVSCTPTPTDMPTVTPTDVPGVTPTDTPTVTPTDTPAVTPTDAPAATPTNTPSATSTPTPSQDVQGSSASTSETPVKVQGAQATLGASTMAATGTFENTLMIAMFTAGMMILGLGAVSYAKETK